MFKVKHKLCPEIVQSLFCQREGKRSGASFLRPLVNSVYNGEQSFRSFGPVVWDTMLPGNFKVISNLENFKIAIKDWVPANCLCRLCRESWPTINIRPHIMHFRRLAFSYTGVIY